MVHKLGRMSVALGGRRDVVLCGLFSALENKIPFRAGGGIIHSNADSGAEFSYGTRSNPGVLSAFLVLLAGAVDAHWGDTGQMSLCERVQAESETISACICFEK